MDFKKTLLVTEYGDLVEFVTDLDEGVGVAEYTLTRKGEVDYPEPKIVWREKKTVKKQK